ncbi:WYL domain-containing protein [Paraglaciecola aquimarina]|uniref:WYL domain-containing protein n=1 Tax=Paraglaciecola algarum TaxID=3050085 RepID=A0ABS9DDD6_9ALTE|nr:WYL domain-containing protein [Paraglaciecola sp. G1-23]MCF2950017.1 WYL domain-containing protein [Paraglaciecola sp. G1-23]
MKTNFKNRTERRNQLIGLLRSEEYWKTSDLREHLMVSQRTLMRELAELKDAGYPIESDRGRGGGIRLHGRWGIERLTLSHKEVVELLLSLAIMESLNLPLLTGNIKAIRQKLFQAFPDNQRGVVSNIRKRILISKQTKATFEPHLSEPKQKISENMSESFFRQRCLDINYRAESGKYTSRIIEPHYIMLSWPVWYIIAWDHLRNSSRVFRIDRIQNACTTNTSFKLRPDLIYNDSYAPFYTTI